MFVLNEVANINLENNLDDGRKKKQLNIFFPFFTLGIFYIQIIRYRK